MSRTKRVRGPIVAAVFVLSAFASSPPARAQLGSVSMTVEPSASVSWSLSGAGANTTSGGSMTIDATAAYVVTVSADRSRLSEWDGNAYVSAGATLSSPLTVSAGRTGGTALVPGVGLSAAVATSAATLATGVGPGTDDFSVTLSQPTAITDPALGAGRTYHIVLTYTASLAV